MTAPRIVSIDALRGLTIAFMILVNDPGDGTHTYRPLEHAPWSGFTPTDLVFPMFLFLVGCSIVFSVQSRLANAVPKSRIAVQMLRRAVLIFAIAMLLTAYPRFTATHLSHLRMFGVLTRIAVCYLAAGLLFLYVRSWRGLAAIFAALLVGYWMVMRFAAVPGLGHPVIDFPLLDQQRNLAAWLDRGFNAWTQRWLHTGSLYEKTRDPEGLLSTLPAMATALLGVLAALWMRTPPGGASQRRNWLPAPTERNRCRDGLLLAGLVCVVLGALWNRWFPINKNLWTSSFVLYAGGWSLLMLGLFYALLDVEEVQRRWRGARILLWPLLVYGSNAITAYAVSNLLIKTLIWWKVPDASGRSLPAVAWIYLHLFAFHGSTDNTSLAFALAFVAACFVPNWLLWRRGAFLRV